MKLYEVPNKSFVKITDVTDSGDLVRTVVFFDHVDGMYSLCFTKSGDICHVAAFEEVEIVNGWEEE